MTSTELRESSTALTTTTRDRPGVHLLVQTKQLRAMHTIIRDRHASQEAFVNYAGRINRLLLEAAVDLLPFDYHEVTTPVGETYRGLRFASRLCAVPVIRAGESMESAFRELYSGVSIGKILVQRDKNTKLPRLYYSHLPDDIASRHVLLLEPMLATGGSALAAIDVLVEAGVREDRIVFVNFLASPQGLEAVCRARPQVQIVTSSIEERLNDEAFMIPGIGDFGDRFFGTVHAGPVR
ncbi:uracil phosphoribosyltransferase [Rhodococcus sp. AW25M09]|uniref:uracil phosphoribosyltransferase n=1 Tax=Rhodococcus sp. AW25M09 TaxID=1268303 RepID=UPI000345B510|nr:uracil phosphoribosyltransferase [Rhodococcus sp. AW25M09]